MVIKSFGTPVQLRVEFVFLGVDFAQPEAHAVAIVTEETGRGAFEPELGRDDDRLGVRVFFLAADFFVFLVGGLLFFARRCGPRKVAHADPLIEHRAGWTVEEIRLEGSGAGQIHAAVESGAVLRVSEEPDGLAFLTVDDVRSQDDGRDDYEGDHRCGATEVKEKSRNKFTYCINGAKAGNNNNQQL